MSEADRIQQLLDDPIIERAFENVYRYLHELIDETNSDDVETLRSLSIRLNLLATVKADLVAAIENETYEDFVAQQNEELRNVH